MNTTWMILAAGATVATQAPSEAAPAPPPGWRVSAGYFGESASRPGVSVGVSRRALSLPSRHDIERRRGTIDKLRALDWGARYWWYVQPASHTGNAVQLELSYRRDKRRSFASDGFVAFGLSAGLGWNRLGGEVYEVRDGELVEGRQREGFVTAGAFAHLGRQLGFMEAAPTYAYVRPQALMEWPYAPRRQIHAVLELGIEVHCGGKTSREEAP